MYYQASLDVELNQTSSIFEVGHKQTTKISSQILHPALVLIYIYNAASGPEFFVQLWKLFHIKVLRLVMGWNGINTN